MALYTIPKLPPNPQSATAKFHPYKILPLTSQLLHHLVFICHVSHDCATCRTAVQGRFSEDRRIQTKRMQTRTARSQIPGRQDWLKLSGIQGRKGKLKLAARKEKRNNNNLQAPQTPRSPWISRRTAHGSPREQQAVVPGNGRPEAADYVIPCWCLRLH